MARQWMEFLKPWGEYQPGDQAAFDLSKGKRLIAEGILKKCRPPQNPRKGPQAETAMATPVAETADVRPIVSPQSATEQKTDAGDKVAEADESAKTKGKPRPRFGKGKRG